jgi:hypothetical protein
MARLRLLLSGFLNVDFVRTSAVVIALAFSVEAKAATLGGAYYVDDAEIGKVGSCEYESWASFAQNGDRIFVFSPACVVSLGMPIEIGTNLVGTRSAGLWDSTVSLTAKSVPIPIPEQGGMGLAVAAALTFDFVTHTVSGFILNVPVTFDLSKQFRVNFNFGAQLDVDQRQLFFTTGAGAAWSFKKDWSVIGEVFAIIGRGQSNPRAQGGIRYNPNKDIDCDIIYGRNLAGEHANWITMALTIRTNS